ncbi:hypothetical protein [Streptacidiphilus jiangxiensis]|uniref:Uncharacterized protein n=1 Tax=Streptacidiphilus jiangxiensis TaxID=235985 RepID=A0A1H7V2E3_STRJI|nr:hypothetical protein [Streptacidiphilus jiangxiensis]SEM03382.1 hypothetical protein SAMN05414137_11735 [Streptacidiphilus jiangxiensis]
MLQGDEVVRALLAAVATLEDLVKVGTDSQMALSALEEIASELDTMDPVENRRFIEALDRVAAAEPDRAVWIQAVPSALGIGRI